MGKKILKKYRNSRKKPRYRKRTIFASILLGFIARFGNYTIPKKVGYDHDVNFFNINDTQTILVKNHSSVPTLTPGLAHGLQQSYPRVNCPAGASGNGLNLKPVRANQAKSLSTPRSLISKTPSTGGQRQPTRLEGSGGANPSGSGGGDNSDDAQCPIPENQKSQKYKNFDYNHHLNSKKKKKQPAEECKLNSNLNNLPESGIILEGSVVPVESLLGTSSGFKSYYKNLKKNHIAHKQAMAAIKKLSEGSLKIGDKNIKKIQGMKNVYKVRSNMDARVYFQMNDGTVQIILPSLKVDQKPSLKLIKKYFK